MKYIRTCNHCYTFPCNIFYWSSPDPEVEELELDCKCKKHFYFIKFAKNIEIYNEIYDSM